MNIFDHKINVSNNASSQVSGLKYHDITITGTNGMTCSEQSKVAAGWILYSQIFSIFFIKRTCNVNVDLVYITWHWQLALNQCCLKGLALFCTCYVTLKIVNSSTQRKKEGPKIAEKMCMVFYVLNFTLKFNYEQEHNFNGIIFQHLFVHNWSVKSWMSREWMENCWVFGKTPFIHLWSWSTILENDFNCQSLQG